MNNSTIEGYRKFIITVIGIISSALLAFGMSQAQVDSFTTIATALAPVVAMIAYYIVNQIASKGKAQAEIDKISAQSEATISNLQAQANLTAVQQLSASVPVSALPTYKPSAEPEVSSQPIITIRQKIETMRDMVSTWEGTKLFYTKLYADKFEKALQRLVKLHPEYSSIEQARQAVLEVTGIKLTDQECETLGKTPGFLGAISASADIKIIDDLLAAIDRTPELDYLKKAFMAMARKLATKAIIDDALARIQSAPDGATIKSILLEFGLTKEQANKSIISGNSVDAIWGSTTPDVPTSYQYIQFDPYALAGVDRFTFEDI